MSKLSSNLRFLLWERQVPRTEWAATLAQWINGSSVDRYVDSHSQTLSRMRKGANSSAKKKSWQDKDISENTVEPTQGRCDRNRAEGLLSGNQPSAQEMQKLAQALAMDEQELLFADLLEQSGKDIWCENVAYLVNTLGHGQHGKLAHALGLGSSGTVTKWKDPEKANPLKKYKQGLRAYFGLQPSVDLECDPLFLSLDPIDVASQKAWLHEHIDQMNDYTLQELFPALKRLLGDP